MYANLRVLPHIGATLSPDVIGKHTLDRRGWGEPLYAYRVDAHENGTHTVSLDGNDGESDYYAHAGYVKVTGGLTILADF